MRFREETVLMEGCEVEDCIHLTTHTDKHQQRQLEVIRPVSGFLCVCLHYHWVMTNLKVEI
jgi:hypothetical protein